MVQHENKHGAGCNANRRGGRRAGRTGGRGGQVGRDRPSHGRNDNDNDLAPDDNEDEEDDGFGFQEAKDVACIHGGESTPSSHQQIKQLVREVNVAQPSDVATRPLRWSEAPITFDNTDHPERTSGVGLLPLVVSPMICNIKVTCMLIDGAGLNILCPKVFEKMQIPVERLRPMNPFQGVNLGSSTPIEEVSLWVTFGTKDNFRSKNIVFDVADIYLSYNGILGRPVLTKFIAASHYTYNMLKMLGP